MSKNESSSVEAPERIYIQRATLPSYASSQFYLHPFDDCVEYVRADTRVPDLVEGQTIPAETFHLLRRQLHKLTACPCGMCSNCIEILGGDIIPIVDSIIERLALPASPVTPG